MTGCRATTCLQPSPNKRISGPLTTRALRLPNTSGSYSGRIPPTGATHYLCLDSLKAQCLLAFAHLLVQHEQGRAVLSGHLEPLDYLGGGLLLLDLLLNEPVQQDLR